MIYFYSIRLVNKVCPTKYFPYEFFILLAQNWVKTGIR